jgi:drug/metabolite transporter (DMT)-like permease
MGGPDRLEPLLPKQRKRTYLGCVALASVVCSWVGQSEVAQHIQASKSVGGLDFNKPYLVTWLNHGAMALVLPLVWWRTPGLWARCSSECDAPMRKVLLLCSALALLYTIGDYTWYLALPLTSVAEATAIFNSQSIFTFALSVVLLGERIVALKVASRPSHTLCYAVP